MPEGGSRGPCCWWQGLRTCSAESALVPGMSSQTLLPAYFLWSPQVSVEETDSVEVSAEVQSAVSMVVGRPAISEVRWEGFRKDPEQTPVEE